MFDLRADPYERADITSNTYWDWVFDPRLPAGPGAGLRRGLPRDLQGLPAGAEGGELLARPDRERLSEQLQHVGGRSSRTTPARIRPAPASRGRVRSTPIPSGERMKTRQGRGPAAPLRTMLAWRGRGLAATHVRWRSRSNPLAPAPAAGQQRRNILVIFGDDIGQTNISAYSFGVMGYRTPNIDRIAKEGMMFTDYYAENSCTAGRSTFITGQIAAAHRPVQGRHPRRRGRPAGPRHHHRPGAEAARLRHRPVRQEPPRRPRRIPADHARLRRVLRQPLPPQCRGGAGAALLTARTRTSVKANFAARRASRASPTARSRTPAR